MAAQTVEILLLGRAITPSRHVPKGPASVAPAVPTDRDREAVEKVNVAVGRKEVHQNPLLDHGEGGALSGKGLVGPELREEVPPVPVEVPVDRGIVMTTLLFTEDLHR